MAETDAVTPMGHVVRLATADYYKLRTREADAAVAVARAHALVKAKEALVAELAVKYGFDPAYTTWQFDDETESFSFS
jgi:hypothetical protein